MARRTAESKETKSSEVAIDTEAPKTETSTDEAAPDAAETKEEIKKAVVRVLSNIRSEPKIISGNVIKTAVKGTLLAIVGESGDWFALDDGSYIRKDLAQIDMPPVAENDG